MRVCNDTGRSSQRRSDRSRSVWGKRAMYHGIPGAKHVDVSGRPDSSQPAMHLEVGRFVDRMSLSA